MTSSAINCDVISRTNTERVRHGDDVWKSSYLSSFLDSLCRVRNKIMYVLWWRTVSALTWVLFWCLFPSLLRNAGNKHQNNPLVSAETVRHSSIYIILYITFDNVPLGAGVTQLRERHSLECNWVTPAKRGSLLNTTTAYALTFIKHAEFNCVIYVMF